MVKDLADNLNARAGVDDVVVDIARGMAAGAVDTKWQRCLTELAPLVRDGKLTEVEGILLKYWPPGLEVEELVAEATIRRLS